MLADWRQQHRRPQTSVLLVQEDREVQEETLDRMEKMVFMDFSLQPPELGQLEVNGVHHSTVLAVEMFLQLLGLLLPDMEQEGEVPRISNRQLLQQEATEQQEL